MCAHTKSRIFLRFCRIIRFSHPALSLLLHNSYVSPLFDSLLLPLIIIIIYVHIRRSFISLFLILHWLREIWVMFIHPSFSVMPFHIHFRTLSSNSNHEWIPWTRDIIALNNWFRPPFLPFKSPPSTLIFLVVLSL